MGTTTNITKMVQINKAALSIGVAAVAMTSNVQADTCPALTADSEIANAILTQTGATKAQANPIIGYIGSTSLGKCVQTLSLNEGISFLTALAKDTQCTSVLTASDLQHLESKIPAILAALEDPTKATTQTCSLVKREASCLDKEVMGSNVLGSKDCCKGVLSEIKNLAAACDGTPSGNTNGTTPDTNPSKNEDKEDDDDDSTKTDPSSKDDDQSTNKTDGDDDKNAGVMTSVSIATVFVAVAQFLL